MRHSNHRPECLNFAPDGHVLDMPICSVQAPCTRLTTESSRSRRCGWDHGWSWVWIISHTVIAQTIPRFKFCKRKHDRIVNFKLCVIMYCCVNPTGFLGKSCQLQGMLDDILPEARHKLHFGAAMFRRTWIRHASVSLFFCALVHNSIIYFQISQGWRTPNNIAGEVLASCKLGVKNNIIGKWVRETVFVKTVAFDAGFMWLWKKNVRGQK